MNILIDVKHPAQLNLFKNLISRLSDEGCSCYVSYLDRGRISKIIQREYKGVPLYPVGSSEGTKLSIIWQGNFARTGSLFSLIGRLNIDVCVSASSAPLALAARLRRVPCLQFYDDPERKKVNFINMVLSSKIFFPPVVAQSRKVGVFNCLKEWAYLSPSYFSPDVKILEDYGLEEKKYIFIREVSNKSFNYFDQEDGVVAKFAQSIPSSWRVVLSLEDKDKVRDYPPSWNILEEPVKDIHSLMYFSKLVLSSGDSMAREGAMMGVPSIYCGFREMASNRIIEETGMLEHKLGDSAKDRLLNALESTLPVDQQQFRLGLASEWDDMVDFMFDKICEYGALK